MALTTATEYKAYAGITTSALDTIIGVHLNAAEYAVQRLRHHIQFRNDHPKGAA